MIAIRGRVTACRAQRIEARLCGARLGDRATVYASGACVAAIVSAIHCDRVVLAPLEDAQHVASGDVATIEEGAGGAVLGTPLLGRAVDGLGRPIDGFPAPQGVLRSTRRLARTPAARERCALTKPLWTGIRAIDALLTLARGMRVGIFGPPGCGKSQLLRLIASGVQADAVICTLVGERGTEAQQVLDVLDERTTIVCASADRSAGERAAAAELAFAQAARLRDCGLHVAVIFDSLARYAQALREIALACGESPGRGGYPPSVFARLAALCEGAGLTVAGSITLIATVLSDVADPADPLSEAARSHLDGHVILSRLRAERGAFPAIEIPVSLSRPMPQIVAPAHLGAAQQVRAALARLDASREARELGIVPAEPAEGALEAFLRQGPEPVPASNALAALQELADRL